MVRISEGLIRKRAEHNNMEISTLEEISLHQQDIERIEYLDKWCRELKILYLQSNLIPRIENVGRLKKMEYLNMALNNVERIENLQGCESLRKLDLTINFVGELTSLESLIDNYNLRELFLTGNPCTKFEGYREYVIAVLPQLKYLDGSEIDKSERIRAVQSLAVTRPLILQQEEEYLIQREKEKSAATKTEEPKKETKKEPGFDRRWYTDMNKDDSSKEDKNNGQPEQEETMATEDDPDSFWQEQTDFTPESRIAVHEHIKKSREKDEKKTKPGPDVPKRKIRLRTDDGTLLNVNEAKIDFSLTDDEDNNCLCLDVACFKHLDTSLIDVDVQPTHVKVVIKGKVFQLVLTEEIMSDRSKAQRSQTTGHLLITMPKVNKVFKAKAPKPTNPTSNAIKRTEEERMQTSTGRTMGGVLEVDPNSAKTVDLMVTQQSGHRGPYKCNNKRKEAVDRPNSDDFVDDPDVPPLM